MRGLFLTILLAISSVVYAGDNYQGKLSGEYEIVQIPHSDAFHIETAPAYGSQVRLKPSEVETCERRARVGAAAHQHAMLGKDMRDQLTLWDDQIGKVKADITEVEQKNLREILIVSWTVHRRHPDMSSNEFGDLLYDVCYKEAQANPKTKT